MRKAQGFDVLLQAWRDIPLVTPIAIALYLTGDGGEKLLHFFKLSAGLSCSTQCAFAIGVGTNLSSCIRRLFCYDAVKQEYDFFGQVCDVAAILAGDTCTVHL